MDAELQNKLDAMEDSPAKVELMTKLAAEQSEGDPRQGAELCRRAYSIADQMQFTKGRADSLGILSYCELCQSKHQEALEHAQTSLALLQSLGDADRANRMENQIACIHRHLGDYRTAAAIYRRVQQAAVISGNTVLEASACNNLGIVHQNLGDDRAALDHFQQGLALYRKAGDDRFCAVGLINIADILRQFKEYPQALAQAQEAIALFHHFGDKGNEASARQIAGNIHRDRGDDKRALDEWEKCIEIARQVGDTETEMSALTSTARQLIIEKRAEEALDLLDLATAIARDLREKSALATLYQAYVDACRLTGDKGREWQYYELLRAVERELRSQQVKPG